MTETPEGAPAKARRPRRARSASESLLSIVLGLEAILVFFVTLVVFRFGTVPAAVAFGGGATLFVALFVVGRLLRYRWGVWLGWMLQAVLIATGILTPLMYFIGAGFVAIWIYCFVVGRRLDRRNARFAAEAADETTPSDPSETDREEQK